MPTRTTARPAPTTSDLRAFLAGLTPDCDAAILRAVRTIDELVAPYATASRRAHVRRVARELVLLAVRGEASDSMDLCAARVAADGRLSAAIDSTVNAAACPVPTYASAPRDEWMLADACGETYGITHRPRAEVEAELGEWEDGDPEAVACLGIHAIPCTRRWSPARRAWV